MTTWMTYTLWAVGGVLIYLVIGLICALVFKLLDCADFSIVDEVLVVTLFWPLTVTWVVATVLLLVIVDVTDWLAVKWETRSRR